MSSVHDSTAAASPVADNSYVHLRRSPRFTANEEREITIVVRRAAGFEPREIRGRVLDLSAGGAKVAVPCEVALQEAVEVRFDMAELTSEVTVGAKICWARTAGGSGWRLGCSFAQELPEVLLSQMVLHGYIDRREYPRHGAAATATVQWEATRETSEIQLRDVSAGGFSLVAAQGAPTGSRLRLMIGNPSGEPVTVSAVVRWQRSEDGGYVLGCTYLEEGAYRRLEALLPSGHSSNAAAEASTAHSSDAPTTARSQGRREPLRLTLVAATRQAKIRLVVAAGAIASSFALLLGSQQLGPLGWATTTCTMLAAALATASYQRLTRQVLLAGAEAARNGKLR